jgi:hypothetical protein
MLFWVVAVLSVIGVLAIVWLMYRLIRRWLEQPKRWVPGVESGPCQM